MGDFSLIHYGRKSIFFGLYMTRKPTRPFWFNFIHRLYKNQMVLINFFKRFNLLLDVFCNHFVYCQHFNLDILKSDNLIASGHKNLTKPVRIFSSSHNYLLIRQVYHNIQATPQNNYLFLY